MLVSFNLFSFRCDHARCDRVNESSIVNESSWCSNMRCARELRDREAGMSVIPMQLRARRHRGRGRNGYVITMMVGDHDYFHHENAFTISNSILKTIIIRTGPTLEHVRGPVPSLIDRIADSYYLVQINCKNIYYIDVIIKL